MPEWVTVARAHEISDGQMVSVTVDGIELLVANVGGEYRSIGDVCTHAQCSLAGGEIEDGTVICPCHGSVFDLRSGEVLESPATEGEPVYQARVEGDEIQVASRAPSVHANRGGLQGSVVVAFESRRATELGNLIRRDGGLPIVAPAMRELPLEEHSAAHAFLSRLEREEVDVVVMLTGVGVRTLAGALAETCPPERLAELLGRTILVARGPKPVAELRTLGLAPHVRVPEPNTWRELLAAVDAGAPVGGRRVAVVEYGTSNVELLTGLAARGADVVRVPVYRWALPEDRGPLREAVSHLARGEADYVLFTSGRQVDHVMQTAEELGLREAVLDAASRTVVGSIRPVCSEALRRHKLPTSSQSTRRWGTWSWPSPAAARRRRNSTPESPRGLA